MRNLILILVLSLTALASTSAAGMSLDHAGSAMPEAMMAMDGHDCPSCPDDAMGDPADHAACGECTSCGADGREMLQPAAQHVAMTFLRVGTLRFAPCPASRADTDDPPPPRI